VSRSNLWSALTRDSSLTLSEYAELLSFNSNLYPFWLGTAAETLGAKQEEIQPTFAGFTNQLFRANPIVFGCMMARLSLFSEANFKFRRLSKGRPGELFGTPALLPLEEPWPEASSADLLRRMITDVDLAGNFFASKRNGRLLRMRPDWVTIVLGSRLPGKTDVGYGDLDVEPVGYIYEPGGKAGDGAPIVLNADEVAHFAPIPDPVYAFRGMSWLQPILRDIMGDQAATEHKLKYLESGATPNAVIKPEAKFPPEKFQKFKEIFEESKGNPYGTLFLGGGADYTVVGNDMTKVDFKAIQALGENRICVAARVPAIIAGVAEGLESSTYSNFAQARRAFADGTISPLWSDACKALAPLIEVPEGAELFYDSRDIPYLREDRADEADGQIKQATAVKTYVDAGYTPESATAAVAANDLGLLVHTGLVSVQLQKPGEEQAPAPSNGKGDPTTVPGPQQQ